MIKLTRLNKYLSEQGICSRRDADEHISRGEVKVNGTVAIVGQKVDPEKDVVEYLGKDIKKDIETVIYALNKPKGTISTSEDELGRKNVTDFVPKEPRVYPVGRLDKESEGLILLTNDGALAQELSHPSFEHGKEYEVLVSSSKYTVLSKDQIKKRFMKGIKIDGKIMKAASIEISLIHNTKYLIHIVLHTGYNRQIRKMCAKMGLEVLNLKRLRIGKLKLDDLDIEPGEYVEVDKPKIIK